MDCKEKLYGKMHGGGETQRGDGEMHKCDRHCYTHTHTLTEIYSYRGGAHQKIWGQLKQKYNKIVFVQEPAFD